LQIPSLAGLIGQSPYAPAGGTEHDAQSRARDAGVLPLPAGAVPASGSGDPETAEAAIAAPGYSAAGRVVAGQTRGAISILA